MKVTGEMKIKDILMINERLIEAFVRAVADGA
jgi:hypothetical protein